MVQLSRCQQFYSNASGQTTFDLEDQVYRALIQGSVKRQVLHSHCPLDGGHGERCHLLHKLAELYNPEGHLLEVHVEFISDFLKPVELELMA